MKQQNAGDVVLSRPRRGDSIIATKTKYDVYKYNLLTDQHLMCQSMI